MTEVISNVLEPPAQSLGVVAHTENLGRFIGSFISLAQAAAHVGHMIGLLIAMADDVLDLLRETAKTIRARAHHEVIDPEDELTTKLAAAEGCLSASVRLLDDMIESGEALGHFARSLRRLSEKLHDIFEESEALRIYILEHDADADPETVGPFETADELLGALHE
jgi:hypothetical protein